MLYDAFMTRFGIRKKLKKLAQSLVGGDPSAEEPTRTMKPATEASAVARPASASAPSSVAKSPPAVPVSKTAPLAPTAPEAPPPVTDSPLPDDPGAGSTWVHLKRINPEDVEDGSIRRIEVFGSRMALAKVGEDFFALQGKCPHGPGQLGDGDLDGHLVTCPVHGLVFDVRDGTCSSDPDMLSPTVPVKVKGERVFVMV